MVQDEKLSQQPENVSPHLDSNAFTNIVRNEQLWVYKNTVPDHSEN